MTLTYDPLDRIATRAVGGGATQTYTYVGTSSVPWKLDTGSASTTTTDLVDAAGSRLGSQTGSTNTRALVFDFLGSVVATEPTGSSGISEATRYDGFGEITPSGTSGSATVPWKFRGLQDVSSTSDPLYDMAARLYSPNTGAFTQLDTSPGSAGDPASMNRFVYAEANPATLIDPDGHCAAVVNGDDCVAGPTPVTPNSVGGPDDRPSGGSSTTTPKPTTSSGDGASAPPLSPTVAGNEWSDPANVYFPNGVFNPEDTSCGESMTAAETDLCAQQLLQLTGLYQWGGCGRSTDTCERLWEETEFLKEMAKNHGATLWQELAGRAAERRRDAFWYWMDKYTQQAMIGFLLGASQGLDMTKPDAVAEAEAEGKNPVAEAEAAAEGELSDLNALDAAINASDRLGAARVDTVVRMTGGTALEPAGGSGMKITARPYGSSDVDVRGANGELIQVGGPGKAINPGEFGRQVAVLSAYARLQGVRGMAYLQIGTPDSIVSLAQKWLGSDNVVMFELPAQ